MYFTTKNCIDYFIVVNKEKSRVSGITKDSTLLTGLEKELFVKLEKDYNNIKSNIKE